MPSAFHVPFATLVAVSIVLALGALSPLALANPPDLDQTFENHAITTGGLESSLEPAFYLDLDWGRKTVNLASGDTKSRKLKLDDGTRGYRLTEYGYIEGGIGAAAKLGGMLVGLVPYAGVKSTRVRHVKTLEEAGFWPKLLPPREASDISKWANGDSLAFQTKGGILFFAGAELGVASLGAQYFAIGTFDTYVAKVDATRALVRITAAEVEGLSLQAGALLVSAGPVRYQQVSSAFSFMIDVTEAEGKKAFSDLLKGNIAPVQKLALSGNYRSVRPYESGQLTRDASLFTTWIGIPVLLESTSSRGTVQDFVRTQSHWDGSKSEARYGMYVRKYKTMMLLDYVENSETFYGGSYTRGERRGSFGQYLWRSQQSSASTSDIQESLRALGRRTGLSRQMRLEVPMDPDLGYVAIEMRLTLDSAKTAKALRSARSLSAPRALASVREHFATTGDSEGICIDYVGRQNDEQDAVARLQQCQNAVEDATRKSMAAMSEELAAMSAAAAKGARRDFTLAYARFGRAMIENKFTFQAGLALFGSGAPIEFSVTGENIAAYRLTLESP